MRKLQYCHTRVLSSVVAFAAMAASAVFAGSISSLSTSDYFDNHENPLPRAAENGTVPIDIIGDWFASGECELLVDGVSATSSPGALQTYTLAADPTTWHSYELTLRSAEGETTRVITVLPYAGFLCTIHHLDRDGGSLDARPAGTVHRIISDKSMPVTWSAIWNDGAAAPVVTLRRGSGLEGLLLDTLVSGETDAEGEFAFSPHTYRLVPGLYTLTHYDGIETLMAVLEVRNPALIFTVH